MSAFLVPRHHIDLIVRAYDKGPRDSSGQVSWRRYGGHFVRDGEYGHEEYMTPQDVGIMLYEANVESIKARYPDDPVMWEAGNEPYEYKAPREGLTIAETFKALHCYEYQACETPDWLTSDAHEFCQFLAKRIATVLPGYDEASWERTEVA